MDDKQIDILHSKFSNLYVRPDGSRVYFECGPGWFQLLHDLSTELSSEIHPESRVTQVKEKYGTLRFYVDFANDASWDIIEKYEAKSATICEECGHPGQRREINGWISTLCDDHFRSRSSKAASR